MVWLQNRNWIAVLSARITGDPSTPSQHIYSHSSKDIPKWRLHASFDGNDCWTFQTSYCIKEWEEKGASGKSEKQKAGEEKQWEGKCTNGKGREYCESGYRFQWEGLFYLSPVEREYNCWLLFALFLEIIRNTCGNYRAAWMAVFMLLVTKGSSWTVMFPLFTFKGRETLGHPITSVAQWTPRANSLVRFQQDEEGNPSVIVQDSKPLLNNTYIGLFHPKRKKIPNKLGIEERKVIFSL